MSPSYILGVDIAKRNIRFHLADAQGTRRASGSAPTTAAGLTALLAHLTPLGAPATVLIVMETTGLFHVPWAEALAARGYPVYAVNALLAHRIQPVSNALRENKTDKLDAAGLTELARHYAPQLERFRYHSDPSRFGLQRLQALRQQVRTQLTNLRKAYVSLLDVIFPELGALLNKKLHHHRVRALLAQAPTPAALQRRDMAELRRAFGSQTDAVLAAAGDSLAPATLASASATALQGMLSALTELETQLARLDLQLQAHAVTVVSATQLHRLRSVPGIGEKTAMTLIAHLPARFWQPEYWQQQPSRRRAVRQLLAYMGAEPRVRESGQWRGQARMSKRGCEPLRTALFQASFCGQKRDPELATIYARQKARGKKHKVCISHLMRRQTERLIWVLQTNQEWPPASPPEVPAHASAA